MNATSVLSAAVAPASSPLFAPPGLRLDLVDLAASIGARETTRIRGTYTITESDVLNGRRFDDAVANGSYRVDIHHADGPGITFRYLNGTEIVIPRQNARSVHRRWRDPVATDPTFYQIPLRSLVQHRIPNLTLAGRMLDADKVAFSAIRVMVNMNQTGEAAGVAAYLALDSGRAIAELDARQVRQTLSDGGSIIV